MPAYETDLQRTARSDTCPLNSNPLGIGRHAGGIADPFDGRIDEFRISHVQRSDSWIETTWNNMSDPGVFAVPGTRSRTTPRRTRRSGRRR